MSIMPDFRDSLTLAETIDLVAFIRSLAAVTTLTTARPARPRADCRQYSVRLAFHAPGQGGDHAQHDHAAAKRLGVGRAPRGSGHRSGHR